MPTELVPRLRPSKPWRRPLAWEDREMDGDRRRQRAEQAAQAEAEVKAQPVAWRWLARVGVRHERGADSARSLVAAGALFLIGLAGLAIGLPRLYSVGDGPSPEASKPAASGTEAIDEPGGALSVTANLPGRVTVMGSESCRNLPLPLDRCRLRDGQHTVVVESDELHLRHTFSVEVRGHLVERALRLGYVEARPGYRLRGTPGEPPVARIALPEGRQTVSLSSQVPGSWLDLQVPVRGDKTVLVP